MNNTLKLFISRLTSKLPRGKQALLPIAPDGGLALARNKPGLLPVAVHIPELALPDQLVFPLTDYAKQIMCAEVEVGASVKTGDRLAKGIIATASGTISAIESRAIIHPSHRNVPCIVIDVDHTVSDDPKTLPPLSVPTVERLEQACISGLGGAGFSTAHKLRIAKNTPTPIHTLLVNAVECEPLISCDEALIRSDATAIVTAIVSMMQLTGCAQCIVAIEEDKLDAAAELSQALLNYQTALPVNSNDSPITLMPVSAIYPSGAEKVLVQRVTGLALESGERAVDRGIVCLNVATIFSAWKAASGYPLLSRIITVAGRNAKQAVNVRVRIGTAVAHVLEHTNNLAASTTARVRVGGPLSGFDLLDTSVPITATTNCIAIEPIATPTKTGACIRCSQCSDVCPVNLVPQQLHWYATADDLNSAMRFGLDSCIECGCCDVVCPSSIPLTATFRYARTGWREQQQQHVDAELARTRFESHESRVVLREQEATRIREHKKTQLASADNAIGDALARARARKNKR